MHDPPAFCFVFSLPSPPQKTWNFEFDIGVDMFPECWLEEGAREGDNRLKGMQYGGRGGRQNEGSCLKGKIQQVGTFGDARMRSSISTDLKKSSRGHVKAKDEARTPKGSRANHFMAGSQKTDAIPPEEQCSERKRYQKGCAAPTRGFGPGDSFRFSDEKEETRRNSTKTQK